MNPFPTTPELTWAPSDKFGAVNLHLPEEDEESRGDWVLAACIWLPVVTIGALLGLTGNPEIALGLAGVAYLIHSLLRPIVAVYILIAILPMEWTIGVIPQVTTLSKLLAVFAVVVSLPRIIPSVSPARWDRSAKWIVMLCVWAAAGILWAKHDAFAAFIQWLTLIFVWGMAWLICVQLNTPHRLRVALTLFTIGATVSALIMLRTGNIQAIAGSLERTTMEAKIGAAGAENPNTPPRFFALGLYACLYMIWTRTALLKRLAPSGIVIILCLAILYSKSRSSWIAVPAGLVGAIALLRGAGFGRRMLLIFGSGILAIAGGFAAAKVGLLGEGMTQRFQSIFEEGTSSGLRSTMWEAHFHSFLASGFIGVGLDQMRFEAASLYHVAHNDFFAIMGELGIIGLIAYFGFHLTLFTRMMKLPSPPAMFLCLAIWIGSIVASMAGNDYYAKHYVLSMAFVLAILRIHERRVQLEGDLSPAPMV